MIFSKFLANKKPEKQHYLGVVLKEKDGEVWILEQNDSFLNLKIKKKFFYSNGFENITEDIDLVLTTLEQEKASLVKDVKKTIFFLSGFFVDENGAIKKIYLAKLKDLVKKLELEALGYIEIMAAIIEQLEKKEGLPLSFIFLEIGKTSFRFLVRKAGKTVFKMDFSKTDDFLFDFYEALTRVKDQSPLPIRVMLYDDGDLKKEKGLLLNHAFKDDYFIQSPRIEVFSEQEIEAMLINSFVYQLGATPAFPYEKEEPVEEKEVMGFFIGADIGQTKNQIPINQQIDQSKKADFFHPRLGKWFGLPLALLKKIKLRGEKLSSFLFIKRLRVPSLISAGVFLILGIFFIDEYFFHQAKVTVYLPMKKVEDQIEINTTLAKFNQTKTTIKTEEAVSVTGEKTIGEKAEGEVNLYNYTFKEKNLNAGTTLEANELKFVLEVDVKVASASQVGEMRQPGKNKVSLSATFIGEEGNLKKGTVFKVANLPIDDFFAKNDNDFSGGAKRKVKFFSPEDKEKLDTLITQSLEKKAKLYLNDKKKNNYYIDDLTAIEIKNKVFSKEVGEETEKVSVTAEANIIYYFIDKNSLTARLTSVLQNKLPKGYVFNQSKINYRLIEVKKNNNEIGLTFDCRGNGVKKIDSDKIKKSLVFAAENKLEKIFVDQYQVEKVSYVNEKKIPLFNHRLPIFVKNIKLVEEIL